MDEAGLIKVSVSTDRAPSWKQAAGISAASSPHRSGSRPYLAFNSSQQTFVLTWPGQATGILNFLKFVNLDTITSAQSAALSKERPVLDPEPQLENEIGGQVSKPPAAS